ncbi:MAG: hypothetical protein U0871_16735 [Gemmataceae bacterium]
MATAPLPRTLDLTGLPEPVVREVVERVNQARREAHPPHGAGVVGLFAHLGVHTPTLDEFAGARYETWAAFPRAFPDPAP